MTQAVHTPVDLTPGANGHSSAAAASSASFWRRALLLVGCSLGIYATFLLYGILQERMYVEGGTRR
jgi:hypothetical protein